MEILTKAVPLKWESYSKRLGTWADALKPMFDKGIPNKIHDELKMLSASGKRIAPDSKVTYRPLMETALEGVKCVIMGYCPYHTIRGEKMMADGLLMSCENTMIPAPSLEKFYEGLEIELFGGLCLECYWNPSTAYLSHQGVLMTNSALTTEIGQPGAHQSLWGPFTEFFLKEVIKDMDVPVVFLGNDALVHRWCLGWDRKAPVYELYHPISASYKSTKAAPARWDTQGAFSSINEYLKESGREPIIWLEKRMNDL